MAKSENKRRTKGEGSLEFNEKKKKWVARITAHRADGSSFRKTFEGKTQKEAKSKRDEWLRHHKEESERIRSNEAFGKYVNEWMENKNCFIFKFISCPTITGEKIHSA